MDGRREGPGIPGGRGKLKMTMPGARRWAGITLVVLIIGVAVVGVSMGRGVWEWAVYSDWEPGYGYPKSQHQPFMSYKHLKAI